MYIFRTCQDSYMLFHNTIAQKLKKSEDVLDTPKRNKNIIPISIFANLYLVLVSQQLPVLINGHSAHCKEFKPLPSVHDYRNTRCFMHTECKYKKGKLPN